MGSTVVQQQLTRYTCDRCGAEQDLPSGGHPADQVVHVMPWAVTYGFRGISEFMPSELCDRCIVELALFLGADLRVAGFPADRTVRFSLGDKSVDAELGRPGDGLHLWRWPDGKPMGSATEVAMQRAFEPFMLQAGEVWRDQREGST